MTRPNTPFNRNCRGFAFTCCIPAICFAILGGMPGRHALAKPEAADGRTAFVVQLRDVPSWEDFAFLAAVPAATVSNDGQPSLISLDESGAITREIDDYLRRYKPTDLYCVGPKPRQSPDSTRSWSILDATSAETAACLLAETFWKSSDTAVVCREDDYTSALVASALAARLRAPLLFSRKKGLSKETARQIKKLGVKKAIVVGKAQKNSPTLKKSGCTITKLKDAAAALAWMQKQKMVVSYFAAVNPNDRKATVIKKLSLAAPLLAAARQGAVVPLSYKTLWKEPFFGAECKDNIPEGTPESKKTPRMGVTSVNGSPFAFVVTSGKHEKDYFHANIDLNRDGDFSDAGEGPFGSGDTVTLGDTRYSISLGKKNGAHKADIRLTTPCADRVITDLKKFHEANGRPPEYLCIVGMPDAIPQAIIRDRRGSNRDLPSDFPFANTDDDLFAEIAVARLIAENASFASLYTSRVITCQHLLAPSWSARAAQARWENTYAKLFENYGFTIVPHHDVNTLKWIERPSDGGKGRRAKAITQDSPLTSVAALAHTAHSWWHDLGQTYDWESKVLLAPTLVESGGCLTTALDRQPDFRSVVSRLMRNGAVGYAGNALPAIAYQEQQRIGFWNAVLAGRTIGQAHREATNSTAAVVLETDQTTGGPNRFQLYIRGLFGDPAFRMHVPEPPHCAPAEVKTKGDVVSVHAPAAWWPTRIRVPEDWKKWKDKNLYVLRGAGTYPNRHWVGTYDAEETYVDATFRTKRKVKRIEQVQSPPDPLGWTGEYVVDENADGTRTYRWRVRIADFDQIKGEIISKVDRLDYRMIFEDES